jgi:alpha-beta hydrolase superfamily lysophospholipase
MEKVEFKNERGLILSGVLYPNETEKILIICHGSTSTKDRIRFKEISRVVHETGFAVLRFDFSGCGESEFDTISVKKEIQDLNAAISFVKEKDYKQIFLFGESLGGLIVLECYAKDISSIILWAAVTYGCELSKDKYNETIEPKLSEKPLYKSHKDGKIFYREEEYFEERRKVDSKSLLSKIKCPVLVLHGSEDKVVPLEKSKEAMNYLVSKSKLVVIPKGTHQPSLEVTQAISKEIIGWLKFF